MSYLAYLAHHLPARHCQPTKYLCPRDAVHASKHLRKAAESTGIGTQASSFECLQYTSCSCVIVRIVATRHCRQDDGCVGAGDFVDVRSKV